jgi:hypothetical protein
MSKPKIVTICSSASFYKQAIEAAELLEQKGISSILPASAREMKQSGNFAVSDSKTWLKNPDDYHKKTAYIRGHLDEVAAGDAILVLNYEKHGQANYIGGNVLMEMALAFYLKKPIYILNDLPTDSIFQEEIIGLEPIILRGQLDRLISDFK